MINLAPLKSNVSQLRSDLKKVKGTLALITSLPGFFRDRIAIEQAQEEIKRALDSREQRFLELARTEIYQRPTSPYLRLLKLAGCEFSDLQLHVHSHGLEKTLEYLAKEGVYLTSDEFKGKKEVVRGGDCFRVSPGDFERLDPHPGFATQSSGTKDKPVLSHTSLDWVAIRALAAGIFFSAHNLFSYSHALYDAMLPGSGFVHLFFFAKFGKEGDRWFARKIPVETWLEGKYHYLATYLMVLTGKWFGPGFLKPELIDIPEIHRIVRWIEAKRREGKSCLITTVASSAARIARVASEMGISLERTKFNVAGEPLTQAKEETIKRVGASITSRYSYGGAITVGFGCANPLFGDEIHINQDMLALIRHPRPLATPHRFNPFFAPHCILQLLGCSSMSKMGTMRHWIEETVVVL